MNTGGDQQLEVRQPGAQGRESGWELRVLETPAEMSAVEELSLVVWPGSELGVVPGHLLVTVAHNGGLVAGAFTGQTLVGFVFGFPGFQATPQGLRPKHCSHQLAVHPDYRNSGLGFALKRLQWQFVRAQDLERVTWTYHPLLSRNANLNIAKLGAVCNTYLRNAYGELLDEPNAGGSTDRFQVDWWVNSGRVVERMAGMRRAPYDLDSYLRKGAVLLNAPTVEGQPTPPDPCSLQAQNRGEADCPADVLLEIPADFPSLEATRPDLGLVWRMQTRACFERLFEQGLAVTDFIYRRGPTPRALYVLSRLTFEEEHDR
jgi:predicted GNAT superfamily acetyltransferase